MHTGGYDLHTHSSFSDGTTSVTEIAQLVAKANIAGFALTDHDTVAGWDTAREAAATYGLDFVPGIELNTRYNGLALHLLGYGFDPLDTELTRQLADLRKKRAARAQKMVAKIAADYPLTWEQVVCGSPESVGRPHIADALISLGVVPDRKTAFQTVLAGNSKYYVPAADLDTTVAVRLLRNAGGVPVLAHPAAFRTRRAITRSELVSLCDAGLAGIELRHPENTAPLLVKVQQAAVNLPLVVTGASDFHGAGKPNRIAEYTTSAAAVAKLRAQMRYPR